jgi:hypothetical protein
MKKMTLMQVINHFNKFNDMDFDRDVAVRMAKLLVEKFGFEDKKDYSGHHGVVQMFDWKNGDGTLFGYLPKWGYGKIEIGQSYDRNGKLDGKGWFCPDFD